MTRWILILSLGLLALSPAAVQAGDADRVSFGADIVIPEGETVRGDVVVVGASATVLGHVEGDLVVLAGNLVLGAESQVDGDAMHVGGDLLKSDAAAIAGSSVGMVQSSLSPSQLTGQIEGAASASANGGSFVELRGTNSNKTTGGGTPFVVEAIATLFFSVFLLVTGLLFMSFWPERSTNLRRTLEASPWVSLGLGALVSTGLFLVAVLLGLTVVGLIAIPFLGTAALAVWVVGITGVLEALGDRVPLPQALRTRAGHFAAGCAIFAVLGGLWAAGGVPAVAALTVAIGMGCMAFGAALLSGLGKAPYSTP